MFLPSLLLLLLLALIYWWFDSLGAREAAIHAARAACESDGVLFLDETVSGARTRFARTESGTLALSRIYHFEYSDTGNNRRPGSIEMLGRNVLHVNIGLRLVLH